MSKRVTLEAVRDRVTRVVLKDVGTVEEQLIANGLIDSVKAINLALSLEKEFGVSLEDLSLADMITLSKLSHKVYSIISNRAD